MNILGVDFGLKKVGVAIANGTLAVPLMVLRYEDIKILINKIKSLCEKENIEKIIVGVSEGKMEEETKKFIESLKLKTNITVETFDETLSTQDAQKLAIEAGIKRSKRKEMEDAMAAAIMLQNYIDIHCI